MFDRDTRQLLLKWAFVYQILEELLLEIMQFFGPSLVACRILVLRDRADMKKTINALRAKAFPWAPRPRICV